MTRLFIAGIMQGSKHEMAVHNQDYRGEISAIVRRHHPDVEFIDPFELYPESVNYAREQATNTFLDILGRVATADAMIAYLPEASLGTAIEIWEAYEAGKPVFAISPMENNWMLWVTATQIFPDMASFAAFVAEGGLALALQRP